MSYVIASISLKWIHIKLENTDRATESISYRALHYIASYSHPISTKPLLMLLHLAIILIPTSITTSLPHKYLSIMSINHSPSYWPSTATIYTSYLKYHLTHTPLIFPSELSSNICTLHLINLNYHLIQWPSTWWPCSRWRVLSSRKNKHSLLHIHSSTWSKPTRTSCYC